MNRLKQIRVSAGMRQSDLAARLNCSATTISNYEVGFRDIDSMTINRLCDIFGCTADYLLGRSDLETPELTEDEARILRALRRCDDRAMDMVKTALRPFMEEQSEETAI